MRIMSTIASTSLTTILLDSESDPLHWRWNPTSQRMSLLPGFAHCLPDTLLPNCREAIHPSRK